MFKGKIDASLIFSFSLFSFFLLIFNPYVYWDDYTLINQTDSNVQQMFNDAGFYFVGYFHRFLLSFDTVLLYRLSTYLCFLFGALILNQIVSILIPTGHSNLPLLIALFFLTIPMNLAKITLITLFYSLCILWFLLACLMTIKHFLTRKYSYLLMALCLFLVSFITSSFIPTYLFFLSCYTGYCIVKKVENRTFPKLLTLYALPFFFWIVKSLVFPSQGGYADYNVVSIDAINWQLFENVCETALGNLSSLLFKGIESVIQHFVIFIFAAAFIFYLLIKLIPEKESVFNYINWVIVVAFSVCFLLVSVFPYCLVGKPPGFLDWSSRHQLILSIATSVFIATSIQPLRKLSHWLYVATSSLLLAVFLFGTVENQWDLIIDGVKQEAIKSQFGTNKTILTNQSFVVRDKKVLNFAERELRFYEYNALSKMVTKSTDKFFNPEHFHLQGVTNFDNIKYKHFSAENFQPTSPTHIIIIDDKELSFSESYPLVVKSIFRQKITTEELSEVLSLDVMEIGKIDE